MSEMPETSVKEPKRSFSIDRPFLGNYAITEDAVREAFSRLKRDHKNCDIAVAFASQRKVEAEDIQDVLTDPLIGSTRIKSITIRASTYESGKRDMVARLYLWSRLNLDSALEVQDDREKAISIEHDVYHILDACRVSFGFLNPANHSNKLFGWLIGGFYSIILSAAVLLVYFSVVLPKLFDVILGSPIPIKMRVIIAMASVSIIVVIALANTMFPRVVFDFGAGRRAWERSKVVRRFVFGSVIFEFLMGASVILFTDWLKG